MYLSVLVWLVAGAGALLGLMRLGRHLLSQIDLLMLNRVIERQCEQGHWDRVALMLQAAAAPDLPYCLALCEVIRLGARLREQRAHGSVQAQLTSLFEDAYERNREPTRRTGWLSRLGLLLLAAAALVALGTASLDGPLLAGLLGSGALLGLAELLAVVRDRRSRAAAAQLLPRLAAAVTRVSDHGTSATAPSTWHSGTVRALRGDTLLGAGKLTGKIFKIGRLSSADLEIHDPEVSRMHAVIEPDERGEAQILDLGSEGGTWVNGERVRKHPLRPADVIELGARRSIRLVRSDSLD